MTFKARVEHLRFGILLPPSLRWGMEADEEGRLLVQHDESLVRVPGLESPLNFFRMLVRPVPHGRAAEHLILSAHDTINPYSSEQRLVSLIPLLAEIARNASITFFLSNRTGWAEVVPGPAAPSIAIAVAAVKACYGWDESDPIVVMAGRLGYAVRDPSNDGTWQAEGLGNPNAIRRRISS
ncbi:hypothetical protein [Sorangium sp. So ce693]|uniref:hypothetical protein n=1 Tax=Sorangium sp. So ce693 TaxID=3133318 RepID=UPI003F61015C